MNEKKLWDGTAALLGDYKVSFGRHWSYNFRNDPKRLAFVLSRYKFAAKIACEGVDVLELGSSEGIGATVLAEKALSYCGVDMDEEAIATAQFNLKEEKFRFIREDFMGKQFGKFGAVVSLDVVEHIDPDYEEVFFQTVDDNLAEDGICVIGTPNADAARHASLASKLGHINLYTQERLHKSLSKRFHQVFPFGMNDETLHTGFAPMAHFILCAAFHKRREK